MGNVRMRADQINYGASNVKVALDNLDPKDLIALSARMDTIEAWKATVKAEEKTDASVEYTNALALPAQELSVELEPIQDLHGYDHPWAGGAGKNKCDDSTISIGYYDGTGAFVDNDSYKTSALIPVLPNTTYIGTLFNKTTKQSVNNLVYTEWDENGNIIGQTTTQPLTTSASTRFVRVRNFGADTSYITANNFLYQLEVGSTATSYAPYSNICPISGRTETSAKSEGKNLFNKALMTGISAAAKSVTLNLLPNTTYTMSTNHPLVSGAASVFFVLDVSSYSTGANGVWNGQTRTITTGADGRAYVIYRQLEGETDAKFQSYNYQIENGSAATAYVPYVTPSSATISFGQTVYGARIDFKTGVGIVDRVLEDMGNHTYSKLADYTFATSISDKAIGRTNFMSSQYDVIDSAWGNLANGQITGAQSSGYIHVKDERYNDETAFKTAVTGQTICYELATPTTLTLTPDELTMLKGYNSVSGDGVITITALTGGAWGGDS